MRLSWFILVMLFLFDANAQLKSYTISATGDTLNAIDNKGQKTGKWINKVEATRGEGGYEEEGEYVKDQKNGYWRRYTLEGDLIAVENYKYGGKDGTQLYYTYTGLLVREENWRGFNPDSPYDTIMVYGTGSGEIIDQKIVKAEPYAVKHGIWRYYDEAGKLMYAEQWDRNNIVKPEEKKKPATTKQENQKKPDKTPEMLEWERKNSGKKGAVRDGRTGL